MKSAFKENELSKRETTEVWSGIIIRMQLFRNVNIFRCVSNMYIEV